MRVGQRTILAHQLHAHETAGVVEVSVVVGHLADEVHVLCAEVAAEPPLEISVIENEVYDRTNNMYSLSLARDLVDGEAFILLNGDVGFGPGVAEASRQIYGHLRQRWRAADPPELFLSGGLSVIDGDLQL